MKILLNEFDVMKDNEVWDVIKLHKRLNMIDRIQVFTNKIET